MVKISKTYIPKEKEKYMCPKHLAFFKQKLTDWKADLVKTNNEAKKATAALGWTVKEMENRYKLGVKICSAQQYISAGCRRRNQ